eukprot:Gb_09383 [translate_table: standard]
MRQILNSDGVNSINRLQASLLNDHISDKRQQHMFFYSSEA